MSSMEQIAAANIMSENSSWRKGKYKKTIIEAMAKWLREDDDSTQEESENCQPGSIYLLRPT